MRLKIIINRGFNNVFTSIIVYKNGQKIKTLPMHQECCEFDAELGDQIIVRLGHPNLVIASFVCRTNSDTYYIHPKDLFMKWTFLNYMLFPGLFLLFFVLQRAIDLASYNWFYASFTVLWALSMLCLALCKYIPTIKQRIFTFESI